MSEHHGAVFWTELMTRDVAGAKKYYSDTCGWTWDSMPMGDEGDYHLAMRDGKPVAGMMDMTPMGHLNDVPPHWFSYFAVDDVDAAAAATEKAGGKIIRAPWDVPGTGRIAILHDPTGAAMGLMTPEPMGCHPGRAGQGAKWRPRRRHDRSGPTPSTPPTLIPAFDPARG